MTTDDARQFHEVHFSLLRNLEEYRRTVEAHRGSRVARLRAYDMAGDLETLLGRLGLAEVPDLSGAGWERLHRSVEAGLVAFWAVVSTFWPEAVVDGFAPGEHGDAGGDYRPPMQEAVRHWLIASHPAEQESGGEQR